MRTAPQCNDTTTRPTHERPDAPRSTPARRTLRYTTLHARPHRHVHTEPIATQVRPTARPAHADDRFAHALLSRASWKTSHLGLERTPDRSVSWPPRSQWPPRRKRRGPAHGCGTLIRCHCSSDDPRLIDCDRLSDPFSTLSNKISYQPIKHNINGRTGNA